MNQIDPHPACPGWCVLPANHDPADLADGGRVHRGPRVGDIAPAFTDGEGWSADVWLPDGGGSEAVGLLLASEPGEIAVRLQQLASDAMRAAAWFLDQAAPVADATPPSSAPPVACPSWCALPAGHPFDTDWERERLHEGPEFGIFGTFQGESDDELSGQLVVDVDAQSFYDPEDLRTVARDALAAAAWLEAQS